MRQAIGPIGIGIGCPGNILMGAGGGAAATPATILGAALKQWAESDFGVAESAGRVSQWNDQSSGARHYTQATGANQPLYTATGGPNNKPFISMDSAARNMASTLALSAPGTTPVTQWFIARQPSGWTNGRRFCDGAAGAVTFLWAQAGVTPAVTMNDGTGNLNSNAGFTIDTWKRVRLGYTNSTSDYMLIGATNSTGANAGNSASTGHCIGSGNGVSSAIVDFAAVIIAAGSLSAGQLSDMDAYLLAKYGV